MHQPEESWANVGGSVSSAVQRTGRGKPVLCWLFREASGGLVGGVAEAVGGARIWELCRIIIPVPGAHSPDSGHCWLLGVVPAK